MDKRKKQFFKVKKRGKILRIKKGYNPNSSSIGSIIFSIPAAFFGLIILYGTVSSLFFSKVLNRKKQNKKMKNKVRI